MSHFVSVYRRAGGSRPLVAAAELLENRLLLTVTLQIDYSLDNGFFNTQAKRDAIESVASEIGSRLNDTLVEIPTGRYTVTNPTTFDDASVTFSSAPNSLLVFVGGSPFGGTQVGLGGWRTNTGIRDFVSSVDFQPYVGYIGFDNDGSTTWSFTDGGSGTDFKSVARHEMLHVLGIGGARTWDNLLSGGVFTGSLTRAVNGGVNPAVTSDGGHFASSVNSIMRPVVSSITHPTAIDWAALADIGWSVSSVTPSGTYADVIGRTADGTWWVSQNAGTLLSPTSFGRWAESAGWLDVHTGDFNADGRTDVAGRTAGGQWYVGLNTGSGFSNRYFGLWNPLAQWRDVSFADFDGDGRTDVAGRTSTGEWYVARSTGTSFAMALWAGWNEAAAWRDVRAGDFDGDGKADIIGRSSAGEWYVARSTRTAFATSYFGTWAEAAGWQDVLVGDFDGNGKADVVGRTFGGEWYAGLTVGTTASGLFFSSARWGAWSGAVEWRGVSVGDFGGDSKPDVIGRTSTGQWYLAVNIVGGFFSTIAYGGWVEGTWNTVLTGDFAGTGKSDVLARLSDGSWWLGENSGASLEFRLYGQWNETLGWRDVAASRRFFTSGSGAGALRIASSAAGVSSPGGAVSGSMASQPRSLTGAIAPFPPAKSDDLTTRALHEPTDRKEFEPAPQVAPAADRSTGLTDVLFSDGQLLDALAASV